MTQTHPSRISHAEALQIIAAVGARQPLGNESLAIGRADGRVLARNLVAPIALPPFDNSAMDGFALRHADLANGVLELTLADMAQFAGGDPATSLQPGQCMRITTGAALPVGADTVVAKEEASEQGTGVTFARQPARGEFVRPQGGDVQAGTTVAGAGQLLTPARQALAAALGIAQVDVARRPTVAVLTTGDELIEPGLPLAAGQIYNSNRDLLMALLRAEGLSPTAWPTLPDDPSRIRSMLDDAADAFDLVVTCGGVSAGEKDHLPALVAELGHVHFWKVRMRPGMPVLLGQIRNCLVLALPGNPVSVMATFLTLARPLLDALQARSEPRRRWHARLDGAWNKRNERHEFLRGQLRCDDSGQLLVTPNPADASYQLGAAADSDALIVMPEGARHYDAGEVVEILPY